MKIVLVGPVYPYKGGISHYTSLMYRCLCKAHDVVLISYKIQYPKVMFRKEQRDYSDDTFKVDNVKYWINTAHPVNWVLSSKRINALSPDLVIIQWWHPYFAPCYRVLCRLLKAKKLFICHNVFPHERFPFDRWLVKYALRCADAYIVHSISDEGDLKSIVKGAVCKRAVLPTFNAFHIHHLEKKEAREHIAVSCADCVILFFGFVRPYKGLQHLIRAMPAIASGIDNARLLIVGDFGNDKEAYINLIDELGVSSLVDIRDEYIPDAEVEEYFIASDVVILPYDSATQSGIVQIAFGFGKPVIATRVGGLPDVINDGRTGFLVERANPEQLANAIIDYFSCGYAEVFSENIKSESYRFSWDRMAECVESLYQTLQAKEISASC